MTPWVCYLAICVMSGMPPTGGRTYASATARVHCLSSRRQWQMAFKRHVDEHGNFQPLPLNVPHLHAQQRGAASSVVSSKVQSWVRSDAGKQWLMERSKIVAADDAAPGAGSKKRKQPNGVTVVLPAAFKRAIVIASG